MGASQVLVVDLLASRRVRAAAMGFTAVEGEPVAEVFRLTGGRGADVAVEAVGLDATIQLAIDLVGRSGRVGVVGVSQTRDFTFDLLMAQLKCLEFAIGLCSVQHELPALLGLTQTGRLDPGSIVSHRFPLEAGADAYALFASRDDDVSKVLLEVPG
jgi:threonine dehydrogenase-like Zn-dependent dehydrogenase